MKKVLVLGAHPDDIEIGCGGTIAALSAKGCEVHQFVATGGGVGGSPDTRKSEQVVAANVMGVSQLHWGDFQDTYLPESGNALMHRLESLLGQVEPDTVLVNYIEDTHQDHRVLAEVANSVTRYVPNVLAYETPSTFNFKPVVYMDIQDTLAIKLKALEAHVSQVNRTHIRLSIIEIALATAHFRGVQGKLSCAEGFMPVRLRL
ncbi:MAG: PIG-L deacetylase family protein [Mariprofundaceae bacterium]